MKKIALLMMLLAGGNCAAAHQKTPPPAQSPTTWQAVTLLDSQQRTLYSKFTNKNYLIQVTAVGSPPTDGYPVVYVLDGNVFFPTASTVAQTLYGRPNQTTPKSMLIVGIGYADSKGFHVKARAEDYTPPSANYPTPQGEIQKFGGAEQFYQFIRQELQPMLYTHWAINPNQQSLFGHSFGGLFVLYTLFNHPQSFQNYLAASPSLWWNQGRIADDLTKLDNTHHAIRRILITQGELENGRKKHQFIPENLPKSTPISDLNNQQLANYLQQQLPHTKITHQHNLGQNHGTNAYPSLAQALFLLYQDCVADSQC
ncbi:MAG: alpha/beta hydrolase-fold protein [Moraxella sp.]|nr:alpha/beta hydrolase-fold protein [Moraxella sp.]